MGKGIIISIIIRSISSMNNKRSRIRRIGKMSVSRLPLPGTSSTLAPLRLMSAIAADGALDLGFEEFRALDRISNAYKRIVPRVMTDVAAARLGTDTVRMSGFAAVEAESDRSSIGLLRVCGA